MSKLEVDAIEPQSGTTLTLGASGDTVTIASGASFASIGIDDNADATAITIDSSERVGIGTASPSTKLHVFNSTATGTSFKDNVLLTVASNGSGADATINFTDSVANNSVISQLSGNLIFGTGSGAPERMRIDSSGRVLIAGTSIYSGAGPELHVEGDIDLGNGGTATERELTFSRSASTGVIGRINSRIAGFSTMPMIEFGCTSTAGGTQAGDLKFYTTSSATRTLQMWITDIGQLVIPGVYNDTTGDAANLNIRSDGLTRRSTSSARYKNTITNATHGLNELLQLRPVTFKSNNDGDTIFGGLIAEEVHNVGLTEFVEYDSENKPDALRYPHMVSICVKAIQEQQTIIEELKTRITALETK